MSGPGGPFQDRRESDLRDAVSVVVRVEIRLAREEHEVRPLGLEGGQIGLERSGVRRQIGRVVKLCRVDEDADERQIVLRPAAPHQRQVSFVQRTHCRDEPERQPIADVGTALAAPPGGRLEDRHPE